MTERRGLLRFLVDPYFIGGYIVILLGLAASGVAAKQLDPMVAVYVAFLLGTLFSNLGDWIIDKRFGGGQDVE